MTRDTNHDGASWDQDDGQSIIPLAHNTVVVGTKLLGRFLPTVGVLADAIDVVQQRRTDRRLRRLEKFVREANERPSPDREPTTEEIDLFDEIMESVAKEEDEAKTVYYVGLVQVFMEKRLRASIVRILGSAIRALSAFELQAFNDFNEGGPRKFGRDDVLGRSLFLRLQSLGLFNKGTVISRNNITPLGKELLSVCKAGRGPL